MRSALLAALAPAAGLRVPPPALSASAPSTKLVIWDCHERKSRTEITFNHNQLINGIKLRKEIVICCL